MKINRPLSTALLFALLALSCVEDAPKDEASDKETGSAATQSTATGEAKSPEVFLQRMYVTSTRTSEPNHGIEAIFDDKDDTYWSTELGSGPDEGLMLYLDVPTYLGSIEIIPANGPEMDEIKAITLYVNGSEHKKFAPGEAVEINQEVSSMYFRLKSLGSIQIKDEYGFGYPDDLEEQKTVLKEYAADKAAGIAGLKVTNKAGDDVKLIPPRVLPGWVEASSTLDPKGVYGAHHLFDARKELAWAEGVSGNGKDETLNITTDLKAKVSSIKIWNGFQRSEKHYLANSRVKSFEFGPKGGPLELYYLDDTMEPQSVKLKKTIMGREFTFRIKEAYYGHSYPDLVISELLLYNQHRPMTLKNNSVEQAKTVKKACAGTPMESLLDHWIYQYDEINGMDPVVREYSVLFRSDQTFVIYRQDSIHGNPYVDEEIGSVEVNDKYENIMDGNWEIVSSSDKEVKIRIFGKLTDQSKVMNIYSGKEKDSKAVMIFQEFVTINKEHIAGEKFIWSRIYREKPK